MHVCVCIHQTVPFHFICSALSYYTHVRRHKTVLQFHVMCSDLRVCILSVSHTWTVELNDNVHTGSDTVTVYRWSHWQWHSDSLRVELPAVTQWQLTGSHRQWHSDSLQVESPAVTQWQLTGRVTGSDSLQVESPAVTQWVYRWSHRQWHSDSLQVESLAVTQWQLTGGVTGSDTVTAYR